jgi:hypothetical protein
LMAALAHRQRYFGICFARLMGPRVRQSLSWCTEISHRLTKIAKIRSTNSAVCEACGNSLLIRNDFKGLSESPIAESGDTLRCSAIFEVWFRPKGVPRGVRS